jgi:uncharacterized membrane protein
MNKTKLKIRFFTIADYEEEERWLRSQHQKGWKLIKMTPPCFFTFEECEPEDVIYRLDYKNADATSEYKQLFLDFGWEYAGKCIGWFYFRKPATQIDTEKEGELFSDNESKVDMIQHILRTRMLPIFVIFLCCVLPQLAKAMNGTGNVGGLILWGVIFLAYVYLLLHCGLKLTKLKSKYEDGR